MIIGTLSSSLRALVFCNGSVVDPAAPHWRCITLEMRNSGQQDPLM
jgi:hypothetical protein